MGNCIINITVCAFAALLAVDERHLLRASSALMIIVMCWGSLVNPMHLFKQCPFTDRNILSGRWSSILDDWQWWTKSVKNGCQWAASEDIFESWVWWLAKVFPLDLQLWGPGGGFLTRKVKCLCRCLVHNALINSPFSVAINKATCALSQLGKDKAWVWRPCCLTGAQ